MKVEQKSTVLERKRRNTQEHNETDFPKILKTSVSVPCPDPVIQSLQEADDRINQKAPRFVRRRQIPWNSTNFRSKSVVIIHLWSEPNFSWSYRDYMKMHQIHRSVRAITTYRVFLQNKKNGWGNLEVFHDSEEDRITPSATPKQLTILVVDRDSHLRRPVNKMNFEYYLRSCIGFCTQCFVCLNSSHLKSEPRKHVFSKKLLNLEIDLIRDVDVTFE